MEFLCSDLLTFFDFLLGQPISLTSFFAIFIEDIYQELSSVKNVSIASPDTPGVTILCSDLLTFFDFLLGQHIFCKRVCFCIEIQTLPAQ